MLQKLISKVNKTKKKGVKIKIKNTAIMIVVRPSLALSRASWTCLSEVLSNADVASSKIRTFGFLDENINLELC